MFYLTRNSVGDSDSYYLNKGIVLALLKLSLNSICVDSSISQNGCGLSLDIGKIIFSVVPILLST